MCTRRSEQDISAEKIMLGDTGEFERLFHLYYKRLCIYAESITGNYLDAEEIVCSLFVRFWEKREQIRIRVSIESYLLSIVYHDSVNYLRHAEVEKRYAEKEQYRLAHLDLLNPESGETPLSDILAKELHEHIENALQTLPDQCREVFVLHKMDGLTYEEVAQKLNVSINTVRTQITRAMKKMRVALSSDYFQPASAKEPVKE